MNPNVPEWGPYGTLKLVCRVPRTKPHMHPIPQGPHTHLLSPTATAYTFLCWVVHEAGRALGP